MASRSLLLAAGLALLGVGITVSCSGRDAPGGIAPPPPTGVGGAGGDGIDLGVGGACENDGACGEELHALEFDAPNIYFVLDRSGSMAELESPDFESRYEIVRGAARQLILSLGPLINVGAAVFPAESSTDACATGEQVMEVTPGDPFDDTGKQGPTLLSFLSKTNYLPNGGTPIAATLNVLTAPRANLSGRTVVMLLTDGGPNCNTSLSCDIDGCMPNIEGVCQAPENCCAPDHPQGGPELCVDDQATVDALANLANLGLEVYVIGITGSQAYEDVLDAMAVAAGTAKTDGGSFYYKVDDLVNLGQVFGDIAADAISCELDLTDPPEEQGLTNVYFDCEVVPFDPYGGWDWVDEDTVRLNGSSCQALKSGQVTEVKIATGCPTEIPR